MRWVVAATHSYPAPPGSRRGCHHHPPTAHISLLCAGGPGPTSHHDHHQPFHTLVGDRSELSRPGKQLLRDPRSQTLPSPAVRLLSERR